MQNKRKGFGDGGPFMEVLFGHGGHKTPTLAMVAPLLRQQGNGDQRTEECIFLEGEDTTRWFCSVQFFWELIVFAQNGIYSYNKEIIPFLCTQFRIFHCWYILFNWEIVSHVSPHIFHWADQFCREQTWYQLRILSIVHLNEWLWRSEFSSVYQLFFVWPGFLNLASK